MRGILSLGSEMTSHEDQSQNFQHNLKVLATLKKGDSVQFKRKMFSHWGICTGDKEITHLTGADNNWSNVISSNQSNKAKVVTEDFWEVVGDDKAYINNDGDKKWRALHPDVIVQNAQAKIGQGNYSLLFSNCEHFVNWCRYGFCKSEQVDSLSNVAAWIVVVGLGVARSGGLFKVLLMIALCLIYIIMVINYNYNHEIIRIILCSLSDYNPNI